MRQISIAQCSFMQRQRFEHMAQLALQLTGGPMRIVSGDAVMDEGTRLLLLRGSSTIGCFVRFLLVLLLLLLLLSNLLLLCKIRRRPRSQRHNGPQCRHLA